MHGVNILIALFLAYGDEKADQCVWYFINIFCDSTIGVLICYCLNYSLDRMALANNWTLLRSGLYTEEYVNKKGKTKQRINIKMYFAQLGSWTVIILIVYF